jgi:dihydroflavonol-4-reductase
MTQRVLITGISGYVGQHIAAVLLDHGYNVVGTVRSLAKIESTRSAIASVAPADNLTFVEADLLSDVGWDEAMNGCQFVIHVASPFVLAEPKHESDLITPAVEGTKRVLSAAKRAGVKRVVLTSSVVAMTAGKPSGLYGPDAWSDVDANIGAYAKSKTLAERAAWDIVADGSMELVAINPGFILGPSLGAAGDGQSVAMIAGLIAGKMPMIPDVAMGMVDVRDVARLHVAALSAGGAPGKRFIAASEKPVEMSYLASVLRGAGYAKVPSRRAPNLAIRLMSLFDREAKGMVPQLGKKVAYDAHDTYDVLGWQPTELEKTLVEMAAAIAR